jgi:hypothetical protein
LDFYSRLSGADFSALTVFGAAFRTPMNTSFAITEAVRSEVAPRPCGECTACCIWPGIESLGKPCGQRCVHLVNLGCGVYNDRPNDSKFRDCIEFDCLWKKGWSETDDRPDKLGVIFIAKDDPDHPGRIRVDVIESTPGQAQQPRVHAMISTAVQQGFTVVVSNDQYALAIQPNGDSWKYALDTSDPMRSRIHPHIPPVRLG